MKDTSELFTCTMFQNNRVVNDGRPSSSLAESPYCFLITAFSEIKTIDIYKYDEVLPGSGHLLLRLPEVVTEHRDAKCHRHCRQIFVYIF